MVNYFRKRQKKSIDTKGDNQSRRSRKDRLYNGQKKLEAQMLQEYILD
jgi:hypothetical protein